MSSEIAQGSPSRATDVTTEPDLDWLSLDDGEEIKWASTPHRNSILLGVLISIPLVFVGIGLIMLPLVYLGYKNQSYVVTTKGVYSKRGVLSENVKQVELNKIQNTSYSESVVGSALGYGKVEISTAGGSGVELTFRSIPEPRGVRQLVSKMADGAKGKAESEGERKEDVLEDILVELRGLRSDIAQQEVRGNSSNRGVNNDGGEDMSSENLRDDVFADE
jgi:uncharacterized membrane protein YdbT with pleckstrin-like domain